MIKNEIDFTLPVGYIDNEKKIYRKGKMRMATALDEIENYNNEKIFSNPRYHDILMLSRVIVKLGDINTINTEIIENLYEVDFRYLQTLYKEINGHLERETESKCPECENINKLDLSNVYENLDFYFNKKET